MPKGIEVVGVDLAYARDSTLALLDGGVWILRMFWKDIPSFVSEIRPKLVTIDSPLSLARGPWRREEKELHKLGIPVFPLTMPSMERLALTGIKLKSEIEALGIDVIEVYPHATRKLVSSLDLLSLAKSKDEEDAILAAYTGKLFLEGKARRLGKLVIPKSY